MNSSSDPTSGPDLLEDVLFLATRTSALAVGEANRALVPLDLRVRSYSVLSLACTGAPQTQKEIADYLLLDPSEVVTLLDDLESRSLVRRIPDPADRRARLVTATPAGYGLYKEARDIVDRSNRHVLGQLDDDDVETLRGLLRRAALSSEIGSIGA